MKLFLSFILMLSFVSCNTNDDNDYSGIDFRQEMRKFVTGISNYAKGYNKDFVVIPQNGIELVTLNGAPDGNLSTEYLTAIDGHGQEDLFYGYDNDDKPTPAGETEYLKEFLDRSKKTGNTILVTDYCSTHTNMDDSYLKNNLSGYVSFAAGHRELDNIPGYPDPVNNENSRDISQLNEVSNFLYLINPGGFASKEDLIAAITSSNYDLLIMDLFFNGGTEFTSGEIERLRPKANGGRRLVICYMSIGEAEDYRYYWDDDWVKDPPSWLKKENPDWDGNYKVEYWNKEWQSIIYGNDSSYLKKIIDAGFDGVYLDIIDAYEYFE
jgi:cysteinyl-tRNA synthetase